MTSLRLVSWVWRTLLLSVSSLVSCNLEIILVLLVVLMGANALVADMSESTATARPYLDVIMFNVQCSMLGIAV